MQQEPLPEEITPPQPEQVTPAESSPPGEQAMPTESSPSPVEPAAPAESAQPEQIMPTDSSAPQVEPAAPAESSLPQVEPATPSQPSPPRPVRPRRDAARITTIILSVMAALVVIGGCSLTAYVALPHPAELSAQATSVVNNIHATQTRIATLSSPQYIYDQVTSRKPDFNDPLNSTHKAQWDTDSNNCVFTGVEYHLHIAPTANTDYTACFYQNSNYHNFIFQAQMTIISGDNAGLAFRVANAPANNAAHYFSGYIFALQNKNLYSLLLNDDPNSALLLFGRSDSIHPGQPNLLSVMTVDTKIFIFINKKYVASIDDKQIPSGEIGFFTVNLLHTTTDIAFSDAQLWNLP